jgi:predicted ATPase
MNFVQGMNVLVGKNSTGKTTVLEALRILINNNYPIVIDNIIPYFGSPKDSILIEGTFILTENDKDQIKSYMAQSKLTINDEQIPAKVIYAKRIAKDGVRVNITIEQNFQLPNPSPSYTQIFQNILIPKLQHNTFLFLGNMVSQSQQNQMLPINTLAVGQEPLLPLSQLAQIINDNPGFIPQYVKSLFFKTKTNNINDFERMKKYFLDALPEFENIEIEYDPDIARLNVFLKINKLNKKIPLSNEGLGIQEFFNILLILHYFQDSTIVQDESFIHMHKFLLTNLLLSVGNTDYQMITTSHIGDLIKSLSSSNIVVCNKGGYIGTTENLSDVEDIIKVLADLGYSNEEDHNEIQEMLSDFQGEEKL